MNGDANIVIDSVRNVLSGIDLVVYTFFSWVMQLIFDIVKVSGDSGLTNFYDGIAIRIYGVLAIYMLFKVTVSLLSYVINPDAMTDKDRGVGKLITRIMTSLVMLIAFPMAFEMLYSLQEPILTDAMPRIILGVGVDLNDTSHGEQMQNIGKKIAFSVYNGIAFNSNAADRDCENVAEASYENCTNGYFIYGNTVDAAVSHINDEDVNGNYKYTYHPLLGFAIGVILSIIMLGYSVDVAVRVFKLIVLQLIAPIPIISYVDPKSSKDGAFSKWLKMVISVWSELFIKMGVIYFVVLVINQLITNNVINNIISNSVQSSADNVFRSGMVMLALIVGLLFFAKDAPKFICDALGIKSAENGKLFGGFGKILSAGAIGLGAVGSGIAAGRASYMSDSANDKNHHPGNILKNIGAGLFGGIGGIGTGVSAAINAKDHNARAVREAFAKRNSTAIAAGAAGSTLFGRTLATATGLATGETTAARFSRNIKSMEAFKSSLESIKSRASGEMVKQDWTASVIKYHDKVTDTDVYMQDVFGENVTGKVNYKDFMARKNAAVAAGQESFNISTSDGMVEITMADANRYEGLLLKGNENDYITRTIKGGDHEDEYMKSLVADAEAKSTIDDFKVKGRDSVTNNIDALTLDITAAKRQNATNEANDRFSGSKK